MTAFHCLDVELDQVYSSYESIFITVLYHPTNDSNKDNPILPRAYFKHFHSVIKKKVSLICMHQVKQAVRWQQP